MREDKESGFVYSLNHKDGKLFSVVVDDTTTSSSNRLPVLNFKLRYRKKNSHVEEFLSLKGCKIQR